MIPPSGTHTASTAIGRAVGVAKDAELVAVRILDCGGSGTISDTIAGLDWIASRQPTTTTAVADGGATVSPSPGVVIMSLGVPSGTWAQSLAAAVQRLVTEHGVSVVVASGAPCITHIYRAWRQACYLKKLHNPTYHGRRFVFSGNAKTDSCSVVPANVPETITVAASNLVRDCAMDEGGWTCEGGFILG
jgi:subtilisin family serine protease